MVKKTTLKITPAIVASVLGEQVHDGGREQDGRDHNQAEGDLGLADVQIARHLPLAIARLGEAQHQHRQRLHGEAPDHAEGIERGQLVDVAAAEDDGEQLHADDQIDDAIAGAVAVVRLLEPGGENAVFGHAVQHAVRADDGSILRAGQNQDANQHHEAVEKQLQAHGPDQVHGDAADQVGEIIGANLVGNDHDREERNQRGEEQAVDEDHQPGLFQILQLGMLDLAIDLGQRFLAAHGQHRVAEADEHE